MSDRGIDTLIGFPRITLRRLSFKSRTKVIPIATIREFVKNKRLVPTLSEEPYQTPSFKQFSEKPFKTQPFKLFELRDRGARGIFNNPLFTTSKFQEFFNSSTCFIESFSAFNTATEGFNTDG